VGRSDGPALQSTFGRLLSLSVDKRDGSVYVADTDNKLIRTISSQGNTCDSFLYWLLHFSHSFFLFLC
jgi:hypothetical protein